MGLGFDFQPCSQGDFLIGLPFSVVVKNITSISTYQVEDKFEQWNVLIEKELEWKKKKNKKTDTVHLEVVNPRICLLGEGRSFRSAPLVLWVSQVKNPVIISIVGISLHTLGFLHKIPFKLIQSIHIALQKNWYFD